MALFTQKALKESLKARVAIDGPTGSGKTWTALQWGRIIAGPDNPVGVIDTENRSAAHYAPNPGETPDRLNYYDQPYDFFHAPVNPPYDPRELVNMIRAAGDELGPDGVLVIDSLTHYWSGDGGTLDIVDKAETKSSFNGWKEGSPAQRHMVDTIIHAPFHVIVTMRSKMEYAMVEETRNGRKTTVPTKIGLQPEQRSGIEYEFTVVADMDLDHRLTVTKSRCSDVAGLSLPSGRSHEAAEKFSAWLGTGVQRIDDETVADLAAMFGTITDKAARAEIKQQFVQKFGHPDRMYETSVDEARAWIAERVPSEAPEPEPQAEPAETDAAPEPAE